MLQLAETEITVLQGCKAAFNDDENDKIRAYSLIMEPASICYSKRPSEHTYSPSPALPMEPISRISADDWVDCERGDGESSQPKSNKSLNIESEDGHAAHVEDYEIRSTNDNPYLPSLHQRLRPKLLQRSKSRRMVIRFLRCCQKPRDDFACHRVQAPVRVLSKPDHLLTINALQSKTTPQVILN